MLPSTARPPRAIPKPKNFLLWLILVSALAIVVLNCYSRCESASKGRGLVAFAYYKPLTKRCNGSHRSKASQKHTNPGADGRNPWNPAYHTISDLVQKPLAISFSP